jgi:aryl-alcohol dehydrogenase-like predicted oxidoreductase
MDKRTLGRTGRTVSVIGLGTWQLGADWGDVTEADATAVLAASVEAGVTFFDTADVYGDGRSEQIIGHFLEHSGADITVATKMGRRAEQLPENYVLANFRAWTERSRRNLGTETLDLVQLHCPPSAVVESGEVYDALDTLVDEGVIANYGVSVETCDQALAAIARPGIATVQIILNAFRLKPLDEVVPAARAAGVGIIARVPLASGLLTGKYKNGIPPGSRGALESMSYLTKSLSDAAKNAAVAQLEGVAAELGCSVAQLAIAWVAKNPRVSTVITGASKLAQLQANLGAVDVIAKLSPEVMAKIDAISAPLAQ